MNFMLQRMVGGEKGAAGGHSGHSWRAQRAQLAGTAGTFCGNYSGCIWIQPRNLNPDISKEKGVETFEHNRTQSLEHELF